MLKLNGTGAADVQARDAVGTRMLYFAEMCQRAHDDVAGVEDVAEIPDVADAAEDIAAAQLSDRADELLR